MFMAMWGVLGVVWIKLLLPWMLKLVNLIPWNWRYAVTTVCAALMIVDGAMTLLSLDCWYQREAGKPPETAVAHFFAGYRQPVHGEPLPTCIDLATRPARIARPARGRDRAGVGACATRKRPTPASRSAPHRARPAALSRRRQGGEHARVQRARRVLAAFEQGGVSSGTRKTW
ncbi:MAG: putative ABC transporter permease [Eggerthella lenta]